MIQKLLKSFQKPAAQVTSQTSFGQEGEDLVLATLLEGDTKKGGFFVDVGAHHPTRFSNTWKFYQAGWRGINIDPTPKSMEPFRKERPQDINLEVAVSRERGARKFYCYNEPALNGIDNDRRDELAGTYFKLEAIIDVPTIPLVDILNEHADMVKQPNFLTIDVEGLETEVLSSSDWKKYPFNFILIEQRLANLAELASTDVWKFLDNLGYRAVACTGRTVIYRSQHLVD